MKKYITSALALSFAINAANSAVLASPLKDYDAGKAQIELGINIAPKLEVDRFNPNLDEKKRMYAGATVGLGNNLAVQYRYMNNRGTDSRYFGGTAQAELKIHELDLHYKVIDNLSAFLGYNVAKYKAGIYNIPISAMYTYTGTVDGTKRTAVVGVQYVQPLGSRADVFARLGVGSKTWQGEIGASYNLVAGLDFDLAYRYNHYKLSGIKTDAKGLYTGLSYKF